jgi:flavodoxin
MAILYGTETGNSEEIAEELGEMAERLRFDTVVATMNSLTLVS